MITEQKVEEKRGKLGVFWEDLDHLTFSAITCLIVCEKILCAVPVLGKQPRKLINGTALIITGAKSRNSENLHILY